jgi:hypothetical protein
MLSSQQYIGLAGLDSPNKPVHEILKEAADLELKKSVVKEGGSFNLETGEFFPFPKSEQVQREINGQIYNIDSRSAMFLDLYRATNDPRFYDLANRLIGGPNLRGPTPNPAVGPGTSAAPGPSPVPALGPAAGPAAGPAPVSATGPAVIPGVAPGAVGVGSVVAPLRSEEQIATQRSEAQSRAKALGEEGAKREAAVTASDRSARMIYGITSRVGNYLRDSQNYFGIFQRPSVMSAIGNLVSQGLQTPGGSINLPGLQQAVTQVLPRVGQRDLDNIQRAAADLAELELLFARQYLSGQGQVTEGERRIVARIPGGVSNSPEVLRTRLNILRERSQFDIDTGSAWDAWRKDNPGKSILEFESSPAYKDLQKRFEQRLAKIENRLPAIPTSQRPTPPAAPKPSPGLEAAREMARRALQQ